MNSHQIKVFPFVKEGAEKLKILLQYIKNSPVNSTSKIAL